MKKLLLLVSLVLVVSLMANAAGNNKTLANGRAVVTYAASYADTLTFQPSRNIQMLTFFISTKDSVEIASVVVRKKYGSIVLALAAGDTLANFTSWQGATNAGNTMAQAMTWTTVPDAFILYITYSASHNGVSSPTATYGVNINNYAK